MHEPKQERCERAAGAVLAGCEERHDGVRTGKAGAGRRILASSVGITLGHRGHAYDCESYSAAVGFHLSGDFTLCEECSACTCGLGFLCTGVRNFLQPNCTCECTQGYDIASGNAHGPIVDVAGGPWQARITTAQTSLTEGEAA